MHWSVLYGLTILCSCTASRSHLASWPRPWPEVGIDHLKALFAERVLLQQVPGCEIRGLIWDPAADQGDAGPTAHREPLDQHIAHPRSMGVSR